MSSVRHEEKHDTIPKQILDNNTGSCYDRLRFFGKGGFAKCYEIQDRKTSQVYAGKIVSKKLMVKSSQRDKMSQEISIHRSLDHKHVVGFHSFFEDSANIYIVLELCKKRSMMELHKRRSAITEPETRFYMHHILLGVQYLHNNNIIHRDLKLGNLFLDDNLQVKIGDFGLATKIEYHGERKKTLCGTPNYIAPEILHKKGHSFEVDIWSIGCIMYTLLVGKPPFETSSLKDTYKKIKTCEYSVPSFVQKTASIMITQMLQTDPTLRPSVDKLLANDFFVSGIMPSALPASCLTTAPRLDQLPNIEHQISRRPLTEVNGEIISTVVSPAKKVRNGTTPSASAAASLRHQAMEYRGHLQSLLTQLKSLLKALPPQTTSIGEDACDPAAQPLVWVSKWVDYSDKYGFGYQLCDESVGVIFNDTTKLIMLGNGVNVHYIDRPGQENYMTLTTYPPDLDKKMKLLNYFKKYMSEHLMKAGASIPIRETDTISRIPYLHEWYRTRTAVVMQLTNGTVQINFQDHSKIILCPLMSAVTHIDTEKNFRTYRFSTLASFGCSDELRHNLNYACEKIRYWIPKTATDN
ncbi:serine/threonine-protein kinase polo [Arctopsyche grandis]|uniref:serine/threonine-protein kinase polo n=1 Tax=Arctopsyche grandis TaxID=121162 RepID=UPI00406D645A